MQIPRLLRIGPSVECDTYGSNRITGRRERSDSRGTWTKYQKNLNEYLNGIPEKKQSQNTDFLLNENKFQININFLQQISQRF